MSTNANGIALAVLVLWPGLGLAMDTAISGFKPLYPKQEYSVWRMRLAMEVVDSLQPTLRWAPFPGRHQFGAGDSGKPFIPQAEAYRARNVRYDVRIWQVENLTARAVVYERFGIEANSHTLEKALQPSTPYFWSIRARFEIDGETRLSEWSLSMIPWVAGSESPRNRARKTGQIPATNIYRFETPNANQARPAKKATQKINPVIAMQAISGSQSNSEVQALTDRYHKGLMTDDEFLEKRKALADQRTEEEMNALPVAETVQSIKVGTRTAYSCTGRPSGKLYTYKVTQLQDGVVYYEKFKDGKRARYVRPLWAIGTNLFHKNNYSDGKGDREQKFDVRDFQGLGEHNSGTSFGGTVRESHSRSSWKWRYTIKIGERYRMNHELLGDVEVVEVHENRKIVGKAYSSRTNSKITPSIAGLTLSWAYEDERGTQNCWLTKFEH